MSVKILLADDHKIIRDGLKSLIEKHPGMDIVGEAENGRHAIQLAVELKPDVVVMDVTMPDLNGMDATRQLVAEYPEVKIIALSMHDDRRFVAGMLKAGAAGYVLKNSAFSELTTAINTVLANQKYLSPKITTVVTRDYVSQLKSQESSPLQLLTNRERQVLQLLAEGKTTKQIAGDLFVSVKTIETHRQNIMKKLEINNLPDLVKCAIREGLVSLD